jgi:hypothetical protein
MWNTGCNVVYNETPKRLLKIVDGEDQRVGCQACGSP